MKILKEECKKYNITPKITYRIPLPIFLPKSNNHYVSILDEFLGPHIIHVRTYLIPIWSLFFHPQYDGTYTVRYAQVRDQCMYTSNTHKLIYPSNSYLTAIITIFMRSIRRCQKNWQLLLLYPCGDDITPITVNFSRKEHVPYFRRSRRRCREAPS